MAKTRAEVTGLTAEMFRQKQPCSDCPFKKDGHVVHGAGRALDYAGYFCGPQAVTFPCHQSVAKEVPREGWTAWQEGQTLCAGGLAFAAKQGIQNAIVLYGVANGWYDPAKRTDLDQVFDTLGEMVRAHRAPEE
jgi:hypothetical protein